MQAQATAHTTPHRQVQEKRSDTSTLSEAPSNQSQVSVQTEPDPRQSGGQNQQGRWDSSDGDSKTVTKTPRTCKFQDPKPQQEGNRCKNCQASFELSPEKKDLFLKRGLNLPLRCDSCIQQRRENATTQPTSTPQINHQAKHINIHSANPWTTTAPTTTCLQQDEFPALLKQKASPRTRPQATNDTKLKQATQKSTPASERDDSNTQDAEKIAGAASDYDNDNDASDDTDDAVLIKQDAESPVKEALDYQNEDEESDEDDDKCSEASNEASETSTTGHHCKSYSEQLMDDFGIRVQRILQKTNPLNQDLHVTGQRATINMTHQQIKKKPSQHPQKPTQFVCQRSNLRVPAMQKKLNTDLQIHNNSS